LSASQAVHQEREQPPSAHTSASCAWFEPVESTAGRRRCCPWRRGRMGKPTDSSDGWGGARNGRWRQRGGVFGGCAAPLAGAMRGWRREVTLSSLPGEGGRPAHKSPWPPLSSEEGDNACLARHGREVRVRGCGPTAVRRVGRCGVGNKKQLVFGRNAPQLRFLRSLHLFGHYVTLQVGLEG
jgi:hypothetical protein